MDMIQAEQLSYDYIQRDENGEIESEKRAVDNVSLSIKKGELIAILGKNGSGKSTLARHFNRLLIPDQGTLWINGIDSKDEERVWEIRQTCGMVFQNPDNQMVGTLVEEEVGFGPENLGVETGEIWRRVQESLDAVQMNLFRSTSPNCLSGGQKQRVAIASVLAMHPDCIVLDEATAMLDPQGRTEVLDTICDLNQKEGITVILITHYMEEVVHADRVFVMDRGRIVKTGTPREIFSEVELLTSLKLDVPQVTRLAYELKQQGVALPDGILTKEELVNELCQLK